MKKIKLVLFGVFLLLSFVPLARVGAVSATRILELVNAERVKAGLSAVVSEPRLTEAAQMKSNDMAQRSYFEHNSPDGVDPWEILAQVGYDWAWTGQNLGLISQGLSEEAVVNAWMNSPGHRAIILTASHTQTGIGIASGTYNGQPVIYVTQYFASPKVPVIEQPVPVVTTIYRSDNKQVEQQQQIKQQPVKQTQQVEQRIKPAEAVTSPNHAEAVTRKITLTKSGVATTSTKVIAAEGSLVQPQVGEVDWKITLGHLFRILLTFFAKTAQAFAR